MATTKIKVPEGMMRAAYEQCPGSFAWKAVEKMLETALRWLAENPIKPTNEQIGKIMINVDPMLYGTASGVHIATEWQRRMFLAPEPEPDRDETFEGRFNGPHILTDRQGWSARCCGRPSGCKWCANEADYLGKIGSSRR